MLQLQEKLEKEDLKINAQESEVVVNSMVRGRGVAMQIETEDEMKFSKWNTSCSLEHC